MKLSFIFSLAHGYKILMINDYHYGPNKTSVEYGKDTSLDLVTTVLDHAS